MSRHAYGPALHQAHMRPLGHGHVTGEGFPKRTPEGGCGFTGVSGDFPKEKMRWYTAHQPAAGSASVYGLAGTAVSVKRGGAADDSGSGTPPRSAPRSASRSASRSAPQPVSGREPSLSAGQLLQASASAPSLSSAGSRGGGSRGGRGGGSRGGGSESGFSVTEHSHTMLRQGRRREVPETLRHAGVTTFDFRRYQMANTSAPFL